MRALPGGEIVERGLGDLREGRESTDALLVSIGSPRLRHPGLEVVEPLPSPEHRLYTRLVDEKGLGAHSAYNSLIRRLVSFERAAECARHRARLPLGPQTHPATVGGAEPVGETGRTSDFRHFDGSFRAAVEELFPLRG